MLVHIGKVVCTRGLVYTSDSGLHDMSWFALTDWVAHCRWLARDSWFARKLWLAHIQWIARTLILGIPNATWLTATRWFDRRAGSYKRTGLHVPDDSHGFFGLHTAVVSQSNDEVGHRQIESGSIKCQFEATIRYYERFTTDL